MTKVFNSSICFIAGGNTYLEAAGTIINLGKVNTITIINLGKVNTITIINLGKVNTTIINLGKVNTITIINLGKVNTIPCMHCSTLSDSEYTRGVAT